MKFHSILVFMIYVFSDADWAFTQEYEALVVIESIQSNPRKDLPTLPFMATESDGQTFYPDKTENGLEIEYSYLCPPQTPEDVEYVKKIATQVPEYAYSLQKNTSKDDPSKCQNEAKPVLIEIRKDWQQYKTNCKLPDHQTYHFGFIYSRKVTIRRFTTLFGLLPSGKITIFNLYDICFNTTKSKVMWTKHKLATGFMLKDPGLPSQRIQPPKEYSTAHYQLPKETFVNIFKEYDNQSSPYKMIPQMMVPHEDFALRIWKETTLHVVNTAPLWENLVPLMDAINDGIRKAATIVNVKTYNLNTLLFEDLDIYTAAYSHSINAKLEAWAGTENKAKISKNDLFGWNIWCKFIYYEEMKKGVLIYLHNLPTLPPKKIDLTGDSESEKSLQSTECKITDSCDFRKWSDKSAELSDEILSYAYCCKVDNKKILKLFNIKLEDELDLLDITKMINEDSI